jgi:hypothetical protein
VRLCVAMYTFVNILAFFFTTEFFFATIWWLHFLVSGIAISGTCLISNWPSQKHSTALGKLKNLEIEP